MGRGVAEGIVTAVEPDGQSDRAHRDPDGSRWPPDRSSGHQGGDQHDREPTRPDQTMAGAATEPTAIRKSCHDGRDCGHSYSKEELRSVNRPVGLDGPGGDADE